MEFWKLIENWSFEELFENESFEIKFENWNFEKLFENESFENYILKSELNLKNGILKNYLRIGVWKIKFKN